MKLRRKTSLLILALGVLPVLLLGACSPSPSSQGEGKQGEGSVITVYKSPT